MTHYLIQLFITCYLYYLPSNVGLEARLKNPSREIITSSNTFTTQLIDIKCV